MPKFTSETARAAAAKRHRLGVPAPEAAPTPADPHAPAPEDAPVPEAMHSPVSERLPEAVVDVPPVQIEEPLPRPDASETPGVPDAPARATVEPAGSTPFTPEIAKMIANIGFDIVGAVTGRPHIWHLDEDEINPLAPAIAHQLERIPLVKAIGPDNTELVIVTLGMGVIVTKRLNQTAAEKQNEREAAQRSGGAERPRPHLVSDRTPESARAAAPASDESFATEGNAAELLSLGKG